MGNLPRPKDGVSRFQTMPLSADLHQILTFNHIEPLVLIVVQMPRRAALLLVAMLHDEETALAILSGHFEGRRTGGNGTTLTKPVLPRRHQNPVW
jgi:hypothetical protein